MNFDLHGLELGFVIRFEMLKEILKTLSVQGRRWWIASDPEDSVDTGRITIGHGDPKCFDRLNTLYFQIPTFGSFQRGSRVSCLLLIFDLSTCLPEEPGYYLENGRIVQDSLSDVRAFFVPIREALIATLQTELI